MVKQLLDYYFNPYLPEKNSKGEIYSKNNLFEPEDIFSQKNLERILYLLDVSNFKQSRDSGFEIGEILANQIIDYNISDRTDKHLDSSSNLIKFTGKKDYVINSNGNYIAKILGGHNIVILKKNRNEVKNKKDKFNFKVLSEIDGLYQVKRNNSGFSKKIYYAIEAKTGVTSINKRHIFEDIILPLRELYDTQINYVMMGFEDRMYKDKENKIYSNSIQEINLYLEDNGVKFYPLVFPFSSNKFRNFVGEIEKRRKGYEVIKYGTFDSKTNQSVFILPDGREVKGKLLLDKI